MRWSRADEAILTGSGKVKLSHAPLLPLRREQALQPLEHHPPVRQPQDPAYFGYVMPPIRRF